MARTTAKMLLLRAIISTAKVVENADDRASELKADSRTETIAPAWD